MQVLYYDCFSGISGDMHLGAMVDLGVDAEMLTIQLESLDLEGYSIRVSKDKRKGISGTKVDVVLDKEVHHGHRNLKDIELIIKKSGLGREVKERSLTMFRKLAEAEARVHGKSIEEIHFHEVGAVDSIVDIVGAAICIEYLKPDRIIASSIELGGGFVKCAHGTFPVPAPATAEILTGIPVRSGAVMKETTTPTGAVIIACNVDEFSSLDNLRITKTAYGIGHRDHEIPNVLRLYWAETDNNDDHELNSQEAVIVECNIDDMNPELYGYVMEKLFDAGADDVFITPIIMKKVRPANKLSALCNTEKEDEVVQAVLSHTTSLGLRTYRVNKILLDREFTSLQTSFGEVTMKTAIYQGRKLKSKPEYEDCIRLAREHKVPVQKIYDEIARMENPE
jgi:pyridinium-3,5-bisthiocarboxylic acid mononucleotide nickel chelatase